MVREQMLGRIFEPKRDEVGWREMEKY